MKNLNSKFKIKPFTLTVIVAVMFLFGNSLKLTEAQDQSAAPLPADGTLQYPFSSQQTDAVTNLCEPGMKDFASKEMQNFNQFLDTNFQSKDSTTTLLAIAMNKYRDMKNELNTALTKYVPNNGANATVTNGQLTKCQDIIDQTLSDAKNLLKTHAVRTSGVKKSSALIEKYQQINAQLADLFQQFMYMKAYLDTFASKMPCYQKSGCVKG